MAKFVEEVFVTEGLPQETFVEPPNYNQILVDVRHYGKPVIIEGQSGTGKTTTVKKIIERIGDGINYSYLSARKASDIDKIGRLILNPQTGVFIIDDFHRLSEQQQTELANIAKRAAEEGTSSSLPKLVLIGINQVGSALIQFVPDIAKRCGIHRIIPGDKDKTIFLIEKGEQALNIEFIQKDLIYEESKGDYWLTQQLCQTACTIAGILEEAQGTPPKIKIDQKNLRSRIVEKLSSAYHPSVKEFCRGRRFRPSNDPYFKLLKTVAENGSSNVDLTMLANTFTEIRASVNNIKDRRLMNLLESKPLVSKYFFYNGETSQFSIDDPAVFYYIRHLDWNQLRADCGFKIITDGKEYDYEIAISYASENRPLAKYIASQLEDLDVKVFYDESFESNFLGKAWSKQLQEIFANNSRVVVCLLDKHHFDKLWPTFERDCFTPRISDESVIPIFLDDTIFPGIPKDIGGIKFRYDPALQDWMQTADTEIVYKIIDRIG